MANLWKCFFLFDAPKILVSSQSPDPTSGAFANKPAVFAARRKNKGFTLVESIVAIAVGLLAMVVFYVSSSQALRLIRSGKQMANASQLVQMRLETIRLATSWASVTTPSELQKLVTDVAPSSANLSDEAESYIVTPYPSNGSSLTVARSVAGAMSSGGTDLSSQKCVMVTVTLSWSGPAKSQRKCQLSTIITKGGI